MDRNQATGLILIAAMLMIYFYFFSPDPKPVEDVPTNDTTLVENTPSSVTTEEEVVNDSIQNLELREKYGVFAAGGAGNEAETVIENKNLTIKLSNRGGKITNVELKNYKTYQSNTVTLLDANSNKFALTLDAEGRRINLNDLYYTPSTTTVGDTTIVTFALNLGGNQSVKHIYKLAPNGFQLGYHLEVNGLDKYVTKENLTYEWLDHIKTLEKDLKQSRNNTTINYYTKSEDFDGINQRSSKDEVEELTEPLKWIAIKQRFFISGIIAENQFNSGNIHTSVNESDSSTVKFAQVKLQVPLADIKSGKGNFTYYFGPNDYHVIKDVTEEFESNLYLGFPPMKWINRFVIIPLFDSLSSFIGNYGIIIIVMVLLIKLVLSPLSYKSYLSMAKMKVLKPELDEIKEKYGDDMAKAQQEQMKLYSKVGVSPLSGCIPMVLQMPILFAMFTFFPQSIELRGEPFLWAEDLSTYDSIFHLPFTIPFYGDHVSLFVLLMTLSTILYTWSNQQVSTVQGPMKSISYFMPVIFMFVLNGYPAALSFYYFVSNLVTFGQQALIRKFVDDDKIRAVMEENKKKSGNKKKSSFRMRMEEAMKASQQAQAKNKKK